eukprot:g18391.t1
MVSDDLLDVDAGGMLDKNKGNPIAVVAGKRKCEGRSAGDALGLVEGPTREGRSIDDITNILAKVGARLGLEQGIFHIHQEETGITKVQADIYGYTFYMKKMRGVKREVVE